MKNVHEAEAAKVVRHGEGVGVNACWAINELVDAGILSGFT